MGLLGIVGGLPSWAWRWLGIGALAATLWLHGYYKGSESTEVKYEQKLSQIQAEQNELALHAGRVALDRSVALQSASDTFAQQRDNLRAYYAGKLRDAQANRGSGTVPADQVPGNAACPAADAGSACAVSYTELQGRCAETTLQLIKLQDAAREVERIR